MIAIAMLSLVGASLVLATQGAVSATVQSLDEMVARGIATQRMDEAFGLPYVSPIATALDPNNVLSGPLGGSDGQHRIDWDDLDDFAGPEDNDHRTYFVESPPRDPWGKKLGVGASSKTVARHPSFTIRSDFFDDWRIETNVYYVAESNLSQAENSPSYYRAMEVRVYRNRTDGSKSLLATLSRVHNHVPKSP